MGPGNAPLKTNSAQTQPFFCFHPCGRKLLGHFGTSACMRGSRPLLSIKQQSESSYVWTGLFVKKEALNLLLRGLELPQVPQTCFSEDGSMQN